VPGVTTGGPAKATPIDIAIKAMQRKDDDMTFHDNFIYISIMDKYLIFMSMQPQMPVYIVIRMATQVV